MGISASASVGIAGGFIPGGLTNGGVGAGAPTGKFNLLQNGGATGATSDNSGAITALAALIAATTGGSIYVPSGFYRLKSNVTVPANVTLELAPGAQLSLDAGVTLTLNGSLVAPLAQLFYGLGVVVLGRGRIPELFPQWWGALADGAHDDTDAIQKAATACIGAGGGVVYFAPGQYSVVGTITVNNNAGGTPVPVWFRGAGAFSARLVKPAGGAGDILVWNCTTEPSGVMDLGIIGGFGGAFNCDGLTTTTSMNGVFVERCWFSALRIGCKLWGNDTFIAHCVSELNTVGFHLEGQITAHALDTYQCATGYDVFFNFALTYPQPPLLLTQCRDTEATIIGLSIHDADYVQIIGWSQQSSNLNPPVSVQINNANKVQLIGGTIAGCQNGVITVGACQDVTISGMTLARIGSATGGGAAVQLSSGTQFAHLRDLTIDTTWKSAINTGAAYLVRITGGTIRNFGRGSIAGDSYGVLMNGDAAFKGTEIEHVHFEVNPGDLQVGIGFAAAAQGTYAIRRTTSAHGTLMDLTNAPATTTVEDNFGENAWTGPPTTQRHLQGEIVTNTAPAEAGVAGSKYVVTGWICTATGTPGTWLAMRALTGN